MASSTTLKGNKCKEPDARRVWAVAAGFGGRHCVDGDMGEEIVGCGGRAACAREEGLEGEELTEYVFRNTYWRTIWWSAVR
jgi:hypothetical protein